MKTTREIAELYNTDILNKIRFSHFHCFFTVDELKELGCKTFKKHVTVDFTKENCLVMLEDDINIAVKCASEEKTFTSMLMFEIISMWNEILENDVDVFCKTYPDFYMERFDNDHGMLLFNDTAELYNFKIKEQNED